MKKLSIIVLGLLLFLCVALYPVDAAEQTEGYFTYRVSGGEAIVTKVDFRASGDIVIPDTLGGYPVTVVAGYIFEHRSSITSITLPASVEKFEHYRGSALIWVDEGNPYFTSDSSGVLYSKDMKTLLAAPSSLSGVYTVADGTQTIKLQAFYKCEDLTQVILPEGLIELEDGVFCECTKLESVNIPSSVQELGQWVFRECHSLKSIAIPHGVTVVPAEFLNNCVALEKVELPTTVTSIGQAAFENCAKLKNIDLSHVTRIYDDAFLFCKSLPSKIVLAEGLTVLKPGAFAWCAGLEEVVLPESLTEIGDGAFCGCTSLKELRIPAGVTCIGDVQTVLDGFYVAEGNPNYSSDDRGVLYTKDFSRLINAPQNLTGAYTVADKTVEIAPSAFRYCEKLTSVKFPEGLTTIKENAFAYCAGLTSLELPESLTTMGTCAFAHCTGLTELPDFKNVTALPYEGFRGCTGLVSVEISEGVIELDSYVFWECTSLAEISLPASLKKIDFGAFYECPALKKVDSCADKENLEIWEWSSTTGINKDLVDAQWTYHTHTSPKVIMEATCSARGQTEVYCTTCEETKIVYTNVLKHSYDQQYTMDEEHHWRGCVNCDAYEMKSLHSFVNGSCKTCGYVKTAFGKEGYFSYSVTDGEATITDVDINIAGDVVIPDTLGGAPVTTIVGYVFSECESLTSITIPASVKEIGTLQSKALIWVDENNPYFASDSKGALYSKNGKTLFGVPASLTGVYTVADGVQIIKGRAFATCEQLTQIILPEGVTTIEAGVFAWCTKLESVNIPASVRHFGSVSGYVFKECSSLKGVTIPDGVTAIPSSTFQECTALEYVNLPASVTSIGFEAFTGCASLKTIDISRVTFIDESAFYGCASLDGIVLAEGLTIIEDSVFRGCSSLTSINIPSTVTKIEFHAFWNCTSLKEIFIPASVRMLADAPITQNGVWVAEDNPNYTSDSKGVLYSKDMTVLYGAPRKISGHYTIPEGVTTLKEHAFSGCYELTGVDVPDSLTTVGTYAFSYCRSLTEVPAFKNVAVLDGTFRGCDSLVSIVVPEGVHEIGTDAFAECTALTKVSLPASLTTIGISAFQDCAALTEVTSCRGKYTIRIDNGGELNDYLLNARWTTHTLTSQKVLVAPTCIAMGQTEVYCATCDETKIVYTNTTGHTYGKYATNEDGHWRECEICGLDDNETHHYFWNGKCRICNYVKESTTPSTQPTTQPQETIPSATVQLIPIPTNGIASTQPTRPSQTQQSQYDDPTGLITVIAGVIILVGCIVIVTLMKKRR